MPIQRRSTLKENASLRALHRLFDRSAVFNAYQVLVDGGKGRRIRRFLQDLPYVSVLDVGCGTGNWAHTARGPYLGVDIAPEFIESAKKRYAWDPGKTFLVLDPTKEEIPGDFDLLQLVSVLHHLSDEDVTRLLSRLAPKVRYLFVLDLYPIPWNPVSRFLYQADRGNHIRTPEAQKHLIERSKLWRFLKEDDFFAPTGVYRHTLLLYERRGT